MPSSRNYKEFVIPPRRKHLLRKTAGVEAEATRLPVAHFASPMKYAAGLQNILLLYAFTLPLLYDPTVLEAAGDIRATATHLAAGLSVLLIIVSLLVRGNVFRVARPPLIYWFALLLAVCAAVSLSNSLNVYRGIQPLKNLYAQMLLTTAAGAVWTNQFAQRLLWALTIPMLFLGILGAAQYLDASQFFASARHSTWQQSLFTLQELIIDPLSKLYEQTSPPGTTFANKNLAASWAGMTVPLLLAIMLTSNGRWSRVCAGILLGEAILLLLMCRSFATWLALAAGMACWPLLFGGKRLLVHKARYVIFLGAVGLVCLGIGYAYYANFYPNFASPNTRLAYNLNSIAMIRDHWLSGVGPGAFYTAYPRYHDAVMPTPMDGYEVTIRPQYAHDDFAQALSEMGPAGGGLFTAIFACAIFYAFKCGRLFETIQEKRIFLIGGSLLTISINSLFDFPLQTPAAAGAAALLIGGAAREHLNSIPISDPSMNRPLGILSRPAIAVLFVAASLVTIASVVDDLSLRRANQLLKKAAVQIWHDQSDEETLKLVLHSREIYPYDSGIQEFVGQAYATYRGTKKMPIDVRIDALENAVKFDPWGPSPLIALAESYLSVAENSSNEDDRRRSLEAAVRTYDRLRIAADFSYLTPTIGAKIAFFQGHVCESAALFRRALQINPHFEAAAESLKQLDDANLLVMHGCIGAKRQ